MEVPKGMVQVVALAIWGLSLEPQLLRSDSAIGKRQRELKIGQVPVLYAEPSAVAKLEKARQCWTQLEDAEVQMRFANDSIEKV